MPSLPLDPVAVVAGAGDLPVNSSDDVLTLLPAAFKPDGDSPVRDALIAGLTQILEKWQERSGYAASQSDILRAVERYLDGLVNDHGFVRAGDTESDDALRARALAVPELVARQAVLDAINPILARYTAVKVRVFEPVLDGWFVTDDAPTAWQSFIDESAQYPDRLYADDATINDGLVRAQSDPGVAWPALDEVGRELVARVPQVNTPSSQHWFMFDFTSLANNGARNFIADGTDASGGESRNTGTVATFLSLEAITATQIYQSIVDAVERVRGQGIRWSMVVDPELRT